MTEWGCLFTDSVKRPPWSYPTYPGGAPISLETVCLSMYSDISNLTNSIPIIDASCLLTSVLPTPVGPENKKEPTGFSSTLKPALESLIAEDNVSTASS